MTEKEAIRQLHQLLIAAQKSRSNIQELLGPPRGRARFSKRIQHQRGVPLEDLEGETLYASDELLSNLCPYLFGEVNLVLVVSRLLDRVDRGQGLAPGDFYNVMVLASREKAIVAWYFALGLGPPTAPDAKWLLGWEFDQRKGEERSEG